MSTLHIQSRLKVDSPFDGNSNKKGQIMRSTLKELRKLALQNGDGMVGELNTAVEEIDAILSAKELSEEYQNIMLLISPTANLQELSIDCGWGDRFLLLADKIENELKKLPNASSSDSPL